MNHNICGHNICVGKNKILQKTGKYKSMSYICLMNVMNDLIIYGTTSGTIYIINIYSGQIIQVLEGHTDYISSICVTGNLIISGSYDKTIRIWGLNKPSGCNGNKCIKMLQGHNGYIMSICVKNNLIISSSEDTTIRIWDLNKSISRPGCRPSGDECIRVLLGRSRHIFSICFQNNLIMSCSRSSIIRIWDLNKYTREISNEPLGVSSDGLSCGGPSSDGSNGDECTCILRGHTSSVCSMCILNNLLISGSVDNTIRIWDLTRPSGEECIRVLQGHTSAVLSVCVIDNLIISGSSDKTIRIWDLDKSTNESISKASSELSSEPSSGECVRILDYCNSSVSFVCVKDNLIISYGFYINQIHMTPITLFPNEYKLFTHVLNNYYKLFANLDHEILNYLI